jgi:hypothetical protein
MDDSKSLELIAEAERYCQRVAEMGMPSSCYSKVLREPIYFLWQKKLGKSKASIAKFMSKNAAGLRYGKRQIVLDHAVPFKYLLAALMKLTEVMANSVENVLRLEKLKTLVLITKEEHNLLMPPVMGALCPKTGTESTFSLAIKLSASLSLKTISDPFKPLDG